MQEQHNDLLGLLAQQELELSMIRDTLEINVGYQILETTNENIRTEAIKKYGSYIDFRNSVLSDED